MPYVTCDTTPSYTPIERISDEGLHFLIDSEVQKVPFIHGVFILYNKTGPIFVGSGTLLNELLAARGRHPEATRFSLKLGLPDIRSADQLAAMLKREYGLTDVPVNKEPIGFHK